jgi:endonuclease/exonuclease/phosphatase family metal-dependent hydrolase
LLEATIVDPAGNELTIGVVHLHAHARESDEDKRAGEVRALLEIFAPYRNANRPHILCGDFNATSPVQQIDLDMCKESTRREAVENDGTIPRRVIEKMLAAGYVDTLHAVRGDFAERNGTFSTQFPGQRVDYIFSHGIERGRLKDAWIETDRLAKYASDHFPIGVEIE